MYFNNHSWHKSSCFLDTFVFEKIFLELSVGLDAAVNAFTVVGELPLEACDDDIHFGIFLLSLSENLLHLSDVDILVLFP
jgi:hypothetical protein